MGQTLGAPWLANWDQNLSYNVINMLIESMNTMVRFLILISSHLILSYFSVRTSCTQIF